MATSTTPNDQVLAVYRGALGREAHVIARNPQLLWPQLHNRLQWEEAEVAGLVAEERERRGRDGRRPWLRTRTRSLESEELLHTLVGHEGSVTTCAFGPDSSWVVSGGSDKLLVVWGVATGIPRTTLRGHEDAISGCAVAPDGRTIASASSDGSVRVWDVVTGAQIAKLPGHEGKALVCAYSPDGSRLASGGQGSIKLWDLGTGSESASLDLAGGRPAASARDFISALAFRPDGRMILAGVGSTLIEWEPTTGTVRRLGSSGRYRIDACAVGPDGSWALTLGSIDRLMTSWDLHSGASSPFVETEAADCAIVPDGTAVVTAASDLGIWDRTSGERTATLHGHWATAVACTVSPDGTLIASAGGTDQTVRLWAMPAPGSLGDSTEPPSPLRRSAWAEEADWVICGAEEPIVPPRELSEPGTVLSAWGPCRLAPDRSVAVSSGRGSHKVWEPNSGELQRTLLATSTSAGADVAAIAPDGSWIAGSAGSALRTWDLRSGASCGLFRRGSDPVSGVAFTHHGAAISDCRISPDGRWVASAAAGGELLLWDPDTGAALDGAPSDLRGNLCAPGPDGTFLVAGRPDGGLSLAVLGSAAAVRELTGHEGGVIACGVTPDGRLVVSIGHDHALRVQEAATGAEVASVFLPATIDLTVHPWKPWVACATHLGMIFVEMIGITYGPLVVVARGPERTVCCPVCGARRTVEVEVLGSEVRCVGTECRQRLAVAPRPMREGPPTGLAPTSDDDIRSQYYDDY